MIDYKEAKKYLLPTLLDYGFKERKDKSCKSCLVFSDGKKNRKHKTRKEEKEGNWLIMRNDWL